MPPPQIVYVVTGLGKQPLYFVENLEGKGFRILMHDEEIEKISTVYLRRAGAQYDPVQVKYMNGDLQTPNELRKQIELAVGAIWEYRVSIINETAYKNLDVDMETSKDMVDVLGDQDAAMMYEAAMDIIEEGGGKKGKMHEENQSSREELWDAWMNPRKIIQPGKKHIIEKLVTRLSSSKWATIAKEEIRQGLMASRHAPTRTKEERERRGTRQLTTITISSQSSRRSTPALEELKKEELPDWAMAMIDTIKVGANLTPIGEKKPEPSNPIKNEENWKKIGEDRRKKQLERIAERREKVRKKEIIVEVKKSGPNEANSEQQPPKTAEELIQGLGLDKEQVAKTMIISDETGIPKTLIVVFKSEDATEKALQEKKADTELEKKLEIKRKEEDWAGIVVYGVDTQSEGKFEELKNHIEKENNISLTKTLRWMIKVDTRKTGKLNLVINLVTRKSTTPGNISPEEQRRNSSTQHVVNLDTGGQFAEQKGRDAAYAERRIIGRTNISTMKKYAFPRDGARTADNFKVCKLEGTPRSPI
ncbi:uncharacterized protein LAJ45_10138 [Morchella importuna]|uniref:uncharacterized protein n=1 Tax=Morchella importuna TaxID=1174673 RepID=UPI001E8E2495|nr:uncharacterized protein LAJ45_10138 [Morchella importuna]KAH8145815.1 hypothetical protein LAJ45_10138 [Morchella importuna]